MAKEKRKKGVDKSSVYNNKDEPKKEEKPDKIDFGKALEEMIKIGKYKKK